MRATKKVLQHATPFLPLSLVRHRWRPQRCALRPCPDTGPKWVLPSETPRRCPIRVGAPRKPRRATARVSCAQAHAEETEAAAKRSLADEYDAAQERGDVATRQTNPGSDGHVSEENMPPATAVNLDLTRTVIHEVRQLRAAEAADPSLVRRTLDERLGRGADARARLCKAPQVLPTVPRSARPG